MRIILDVSDVSDAKQCLELALHAIKLDNEADFGYWSSKDPAFSAYIRATKTGHSVRGRRSNAEGAA